MIVTKDKDGIDNGRLIPIWNVIERPHTSVDQVYVTTIFPGMQKGPHLHKTRRGLFCCIRGDVKIVMKFGEQYEVAYSGESHDFRVVQVPPGVPNLIINVSAKEAFVINMPSPAWTPDDQDDWPVERWNYREDGD